MTRILMLWLLAEGPLHGYRVRKILAAPALAFWFRIEDAAIYSMLRSFVKQGLAREEGQEREGRRPSRTVFRITRPGRTALRQSLSDAWQTVARDREPVCAALAAADEFEPEELESLLRGRRAALCDRQDTLKAVAAGAPSGLLSRREAALLAAEIAWIDTELSRSTVRRPDDGR